MTNKIVLKSGEYSATFFVEIPVINSETKSKFLILVNASFGSISRVSITDENFAKLFKDGKVTQDNVEFHCYSVDAVRITTNQTYYSIGDRSDKKLLRNISGEVLLFDDPIKAKQFIQDVASHECEDDYCIQEYFI